jgi:uncharacterized UPF0160 family protein
MKLLNQNSLVVVHNGPFHADEVFSVATLTIIEPTIKIIRTRDPLGWESADFRVDVGGKYDAATGDFDHHQEGFEERHPSPHARYEIGPKLSSIGLIWRHYGLRAIHSILSKLKQDYEKDDECLLFIHDQINKSVIVSIDAMDNGESKDFYLDNGAYRIPSIVRFIQNLNPTWLEKDSDIDECFNTAVKLTINYLTREVMRNLSVYSGRFTLLDKVKEVDSSGILVLEEFMPWSPIFTKHPEETKHIKMVIFPSNDIWMVQSPYYNWKVDAGKFSDLTKDGKKRKQRYPAPSHICGKTNEELSELTNIPDCTFIHMSGFIGGTKSREGALKLAQYIIDHQE